MEKASAIGVNKRFAETLVVVSFDESQAFGRLMLDGKREMQEILVAIRFANALHSKYTLAVPGLTLI